MKSAIFAGAAALVSLICAPGAQAADAASPAISSVQWAQQMREVPDWKELPEANGPGILAFALDEDVEVRADAVIRAWNRLEFVSPMTAGSASFRSMLTLTEVDCAKSLGRTLTMIGYEKPALDGDIVSSFHEQKPAPRWTKFTGGSTGEAVARTMCNLAVQQQTASAEPPKDAANLMGTSLDPAAVPR